MAHRAQSNQPDILSDIYSTDASDTTSLESSKSKHRSPLVDTVAEYFREPGVVERWLAGGVLIFGVFGLFFGIRHLGASIGDPLQPFIPERQFDLSGAAIGQLSDQDKDTDQDGLSDFDELNIYGTSPYLEDTDSDGISDQQELAQNSDPTCPRGENCFGITELDSQLLDDGSVDLELLGGQTSPAQLRDLLRGVGFTDTELEQFSDTEIATLYQDALQQVSEGDRTYEQPEVTTQELTPDAIRQLLIEQGVAQSTLDQITDAELLQLAEETLREIEQ